MATLASLAVVAAAAVSFPLSSAEAAEPADPAVASLAAEYGLSVAEADARIAWQHRAGDLQPVVAARLGDTFGGMWISQAEGGRIRLGVAGDVAAVASADRALAEVGLAEVTDVVPVTYSMRELYAVRDVVLDEVRRLRAKDPNASFEVGIMPDSNSVLVSLPSSGFGGRSASAFATDLVGTLGDAIRVDFDAGPVYTSACDFPRCDKPLRGGVAIGNAGTKAASVRSECTAAFLARSRTDNLLYLMTAGHCGRNHPDDLWRTWDSDARRLHIGRTHRRIFGGGRGDMQIIRVSEPGWTARAWVFVTNGPDTERNPSYAINSDGVAMQDDRVCMTGKRSGTVCGTVLAVDRCRPYLDERTEVCGLTVANYGSADGDSGGPVFSRGRAFGIQSGRNPVTGNSWFQPIRAAENALNVNISFHGG
jgi:hypothetical protein